jgi:hypothetical protein
MLWVHSAVALLYERSVRVQFKRKESISFHQISGSNSKDFKLPTHGSLLSFNDSTKLPDASTQGLQSTAAEQNTLLSEWKDTSFQTGTIMLS